LSRKNILSKYICRQRGREGGLKRRFTANMWSRSRDLDPTLTFIGHVIATLDKMLYDDSARQAANSVVRSQKTTGKLGNGQLLSGCGFVQNITPPSLSRDRRIKMEQTNNIKVGRNTVGTVYNLVPVKNAFSTDLSYVKFLTITNHSSLCWD